ncbi:MAG: hypothetical protein IJF18_07625 [Oscillospiraceae bacterium]|nr:hypothetical protein [Oscillospiraceae bacterium]
MYDEYAYEILEDEYESDERSAIRLFNITPIKKVLINYTSMSEENQKNYMIEFLREMRKQNIPSKHCYIDFYLTVELVRKIITDIENNKIKGSDRFYELYYKTNKKPKYYLKMKKLARREFDFFYDKYFLLYNFQDFKESYYGAANQYKERKEKISRIFKDEKEAFYAAHYNYEYMLSKYRKGVIQSEKNYQKIRKYLYKDHILSYYGMRILGAVTGVIIMLIYITFFYK